MQKCPNFFAFFTPSSLVSDRDAAVNSKPRFYNDELATLEPAPSLPVWTCRAITLSNHFIGYIRGDRVVPYGTVVDGR